MSEEDKKIDFLEVDDQIPGQNYVCMSFLSPDSLIQERQAFNCAKFMQSYCKDLKLNFDEVYNKYKDFTYKHEEKLQRDFDEQNDFQTSLRGIKVRGVFDTRQAADAHAKKLSTRDSSFHVFIGQVGYWLPWDPNADKVADEVFQNSQLNDMMEKYQENNINRDMFYEEQKRDKIKAAQEEVRKAKEEVRKAKEEERKAKEEEATDKLGEVSEDPVPELEPEPEPESDLEPEPEPEPERCDNCPENKCDDCPEKQCSEKQCPEKQCSEKQCDDCPEKQCSDCPVKGNNTVDEDLKKSLETDDPWMQQKLNKE